MPHGATYDNSLLFKDAGAVTADGAAQVSSVDKIVDVGAARFEGTMWFNVTAIDTATGDEGYVLYIQGSASATFASGIVNLIALRLGDSSVTLGSADDGVGLYEVPFINERLGTAYRYLRVYTDVATTGESINYTAYATPRERTA